MGIHFGVLGPLQVTDAGEVLQLRRGRVSRLLLSLLLRAGDAVDAEVLIDQVWGERPPRSASNSLQVLVWYLRRQLDGADGSSFGLHTTDRGYLLDVNPARIDAACFAERVNTAASRLTGASVDVAAAGKELTAALALWRGEPYQEVADEAFTVAEVHRLRELKVGAEELAVDVLLAQGSHGEAATELRRLVVEHPLRERLRTQLMVALYRSGRQSEALQVFDQTRTLLVEELGVEPGPELRRLQQAVLVHDPELDRWPGWDNARAPDAETITAARHSGTLVTPAQLPADPPGFVGRATELGRLDSILDEAQQRSLVAVACISGTAGVGKTALAVHWAHRVAPLFPDGQLYVNLRGFDPAGQPLTADEALDGFLHALDVLPQRMPPGRADKASLLRSLLADRRVLIVLDNAIDADQVLPLLPGKAGCCAVVTSRNTMPSLVVATGAKPVYLDMLSSAEANDLLAQYVGADRVATEPDAADEIAEHCARLPLALTIVAARIAFHPRLTLAALATELRETHGTLDAFSGTEPTADLESVFSWSYDLLGRDAARLFRELALHPGPDISVPAAGSLSGWGAAAVRPLVAELVQAQMLSADRPGRYTLHDLLRAFATDLAHFHDSDASRRDTVGRYLDHYVCSAAAADRLLSPEGEQVETLRPLQRDVNPERLESRQHAMAWFEAEHDVLLAVLQQAGQTGFDVQTCQLAFALRHFLDWRGRWHDWAGAAQLALNAARRLADPAAEARAYRHLGFALLRQGRRGDSIRNLYAALRRYEQLDDKGGQALTHGNIAHVLEGQSDYDRGLRHANQALHLHEATGNRRLQALALCLVAWCEAHMGKLETALAHAREALRLSEAFRTPLGRALSWDVLGFAHHHLGDHEQAIACYHRAIDTAQEVGHLKLEAENLAYLGDTLQAAGDTPAACRAWGRALNIFDNVGDPTADAVRAKLNA